MRTRTAGQVTALILAASVLVACGDLDEASEIPRDEETTQGDAAAGDADGAVEPHEYEIVAVEDVGSNRLSLRVVVSGKPNAEEVRETALAVMDEIRDSQDYSGLAVFLYDREEVTDGAFTLGKLEDAPDGKWENAVDASPGEYDDHEWNVEAYEKPWKKAPSNKQFAIAATWDAIYSTLEGEVTDEQWADLEFDLAELEAQASREAAQEHGVKVTAAEKANLAVLSWTHAGKLHTYEE